MFVNHIESVPNYTSLGIIVRFFFYLIIIYDAGLKANLFLECLSLEISTKRVVLGEGRVGCNKAAAEAEKHHQLRQGEKNYISKSFFFLFIIIFLLFSNLFFSTDLKSNDQEFACEYVSVFCCICLFTTLSLLRSN